MSIEVAKAPFVGTARFTVIRRLGEGGMGVVYLARDRERDGVVALKTLAAAEPAKILRLKAEFRALAGVTHRNLVQLYELVSDESLWFFTMEHVDGVDFLQHVHRGPGDLLATVPAHPSVTMTVTAPTVGVASAEPIVIRGPSDGWGGVVAPTQVAGTPVHEERLRPALRQLVTAVRALHSAGMLHLDIKPSNVLVTSNGRVVVLDFGLVTRLRSDGTTDLEVTGGTPAYMAPEQVRRQGVGEASDWYAVGALLYEVLTGRLPFGADAMQSVRQKLAAEPPPPRSLNYLVPTDLDELCVALLRMRPEDRPDGAEIARRLGIAERPADGADPVQEIASSGPARSGSLVGRDNEIGVLREAFAQVVSGEGVTALVHGVSGMGKTALVEAFLGEIAHGATVLRGRCYERESLPYKAFDSLMDALLSRLTSLPRRDLDALLWPGAGALVDVFPVLAQLPALGRSHEEAASVPDALERRRRGFAAVRELLHRLAASRPLVLFIDDLQWGDLDSAALLVEILRPPSPPPLLLLGSYRDEEAARSPLLSRLLSAAASEVGSLLDLQIGPLSFEEARALALAGIDEAGPDRLEKAELVARESGGHPYFVAELVREIAPASAQGASIETLSLDGVIHRRVQRLPDLARELLEVMAVAGRPVSLAVLLAAQRGEAGDRRAEEGALTTLQVLHMIRTSGARVDAQVETYHDRVRETVAAHLSPERQRAVHKKLAIALEASSEADAELLAQHFQGAGDREKTARYAARAAEKAEQALAFDRAAAFHRMAIEASQGAPASVTQPWRERLAEALKNAGRAADAAAAYRSAAQTAEPVAALDLRRRAAEQLLISGHIDEGLDLLGSVLGAVGMRLASSPRAALASVVAQRLYLRVRGLKYDLRSPGGAKQEDLTRIEACWSVAVGLSMVDNVRAADFQARQLILSLRSGDLEKIARALTFEVGFVSGPGSAALDASEKLLRQAGELAERVGTPYLRGFHALMSGVRAYLAGRWRLALEYAESAERTLRERCSGLTWEVTNSQRFALGSLMYMGDLPEVARRLPILLARARERGNLYVATDLRTRIALPWLAADDPDRVEHEIEDALARWTHTGFHLQHFNSLLALGQKDLYTGHPERALERLDRQQAALDRSLVLRMQVPRIEVVQLRARIALALAARLRGSAAEERLRDVEKKAAAIRKEKAPWAMPFTTLLLASVAAARGDARAAVAGAEEAARAFDAADMHLHAAAARHRAGGLIGGAVGRALVGEARAFMASRDIRDPDRMTALLAPGAWGAA